VFGFVNFTMTDPASSPAEGVLLSETATSVASSSPVTPCSDLVKSRLLVVDTAALIKGVRLERLASELYTIDEVLREVKDESSRRFVAAFPFEIKTRQPSAEAVQRVSDFSKKTGDYPSLSVVDLKVLALTFTLHSEIYGEDSIRKQPQPITRLGYSTSFDSNDNSANNQAESLPGSSRNESEGTYGFRRKS